MKQEKQIKEIAETASMLIIQKLPNIEFDYEDLKRSIERAIYIAKQNKELTNFLDKTGH